MGSQGGWERVWCNRITEKNERSDGNSEKEVTSATYFGYTMILNPSIMCLYFLGRWLTQCLFMMRWLDIIVCDGLANIIFMIME